MKGWINGWINEQINDQSSGWMNEWMNKGMRAWRMSDLKRHSVLLFSAMATWATKGCAIPFPYSSRCIQCACVVLSPPKETRHPENDVIFLPYFGKIW